MLEVKGEFLENAQSDDKRKVLELWGRTTGGVAIWVSATRPDAWDRASPVGDGTS